MMALLLRWLDSKLFHGDCYCHDLIGGPGVKHRTDCWRESLLTCQIQTGILINQIWYMIKEQLAMLG